MIATNFCCPQGVDFTTHHWHLLPIVDLIVRCFARRLLLCILTFGQASEIGSLGLWDSDVTCVPHELCPRHIMQYSWEPEENDKAWVQLVTCSFLSSASGASSDCSDSLRSPSHAIFAKQLLRSCQQFLEDLWHYYLHPKTEFRGAMRNVFLQENRQNNAKSCSLCSELSSDVPYA